MKVRPIHFVRDLVEAVRFYETLGLAADGEGRTGVMLTLVVDDPSRRSSEGCERDRSKGAR
jgi:hypothetical protein